MRKRLIILFLILGVTLSLSAGVFDGYDFSYTSSVSSDSLYAFSSEKFGLDYTGYGYLGDMTSGLYLRIGFQVPYATVKALMDKGEPGAGTVVPDAGNPGVNTGGEEASQDYSRMTSFQILAAIGPSFRKFVSPTLSWYMGLGIKLNQTRVNVINNDGETIQLDNNVSFDMDFGYRIALHEHVTLRMGAFLSRPLFNLGVTTYLGKEEDEIDTETYAPLKEEKGGIPTYDFQQLIFNPIGQKSLMTYSGYIALGYTYASFQKETEYRYVITSPEFGVGEYTEM